MEEPKVIADPIHGTIVLQPYLIKIINHPYFQRLRHIKQLQTVEHVYPGGVHSRFSHSIGVSFLAGKVLDTLEKNGTPIDEYDRMCVTIAALCHDIGHGPFSHLYEHVAKDIDGKKWKHEEKSLEITEELLKELDLFKKFGEEKKKDAIDIIKKMIKGKAVQTVDKTTKEITDEMTDEERKKAFLYQIVNNEDNGVDVDKWDYFTRDSHACGFPSNFDTDRAIAMVRVRELKLEGEKTANVLSFPKKDEINLYNMFGLRYTLHSKVYKHQVVICVGEMIADVLKLVDSTEMLKYNDKFITTKNCRQQKAVDEYCLMDDRLIYLIYNTEKTGENVAKARKIIDRIHRRDFYKCVFERTLPKEPSDKEKDRLERALKKCLEQSNDDNPGLEDCRIKFKCINYGNGNENPIQNVYFYGKEEKREVIKNVKNITPMVPQCFEENTIQIICTLSKEEIQYKPIDLVKIKQKANEVIDNI